jgi:hypothetical protein
MIVLRSHAVKVGAWALVAGVLAGIPIAASAVSGNTTVNATVNSIISVTTVSPVSVSLTPTAGGVVSSSSDTVTVNTNNSAGYNLTLADTDANTSLVSGANSITAHTGTQTTPTALANNTWGYRVVGVGGFGATAYSVESNNSSSTSTWAGVPASGSPVTLKTTGTTATDDITTVYYGVKATASKPSGTYTDTVTYTATTN